MSEPQRSPCLVCDRPPHIRGLCSRCYNEARVAIADGTTTEEELERLGLILPKHSRKKVSPFMAALMNRREGEFAAPAVANQDPPQSQVEAWALATWDIS